ncbi:hypothetical protein QTP88_004729 [Uroleucon formosanum]
MDATATITMFTTNRYRMPSAEDRVMVICTDAKNGRVTDIRVALGEDYARTHTTHTTGTADYASANGRRDWSVVALCPVERWRAPVLSRTSAANHAVSVLLMLWW